jgi:hypothetical protein
MFEELKKTGHSCIDISIQIEIKNLRFQKCNILSLAFESKEVFIYMSITGVSQIQNLFTCYCLATTDQWFVLKFENNTEQKRTVW